MLSDVDKVGPLAVVTPFANLTFIVALIDIGPLRNHLFLAIDIEMLTHQIGSFLVFEADCHVCPCADIDLGIVEAVEQTLTFSSSTHTHTPRGIDLVDHEASFLIDTAPEEAPVIERPSAGDTVLNGDEA